MSILAALLLTLTFVSDNEIVTAPCCELLSHCWPEGMVDHAISMQSAHQSDYIVGYYFEGEDLDGFLGAGEALGAIDWTESVIHVTEDDAVSLTIRQTLPSSSACSSQDHCVSATDEWCKAAGHKGVIEETVEITQDGKMCSGKCEQGGAWVLITCGGIQDEPDPAGNKNVGAKKLSE